MSIRLISQVWDLSYDSHSTKLLMIALADQANDEGHCWPGIDTLCRKCDLSRQAVLDQISKLEARGSIVVTRSKGTVNHYQIVLEALPALHAYKAALTQLDFKTECPKIDQSTPLTTTSQPARPHQSTPLTGVVNAVDPIRNITTNEPSYEPPTGVDPKLWEEWISYRKKLGKVKDWKALFSKQAEWISSEPAEDRAEILNQSLRQGWQGLFAVKRNGKQVSAPSSQPSGMDKVIHQKEYERIIDRMRVIKSSYGEMQTWSRQDAAEFKRLLDRKKQLKSILGITL